MSGNFCGAGDPVRRYSFAGADNFGSCRELHGDRPAFGARCAHASCARACGDGHRLRPHGCRGTADDPRDGGSCHIDAARDDARGARRARLYRRAPHERAARAAHRQLLCRARLRGAAGRGRRFPGFFPPHRRGRRRGPGDTARGGRHRQSLPYRRRREAALCHGRALRWVSREFHLGESA